MRGGSPGEHSYAGITTLTSIMRACVVATFGRCIRFCESASVVTRIHPLHKLVFTMARFRLTRREERAVRTCDGAVYASGRREPRPRNQRAARKKALERASGCFRY